MSRVGEDRNKTKNNELDSETIRLLELNEIIIFTARSEEIRKGRSEYCERGMSRLGRTLNVERTKMDNRRGRGAELQTLWSAYRIRNRWDGGGEGEPKCICL